jgi:hypothetical protein
MSVAERLVAITALVGGGAIVYFAACGATGLRPRHLRARST